MKACRIYVDAATGKRYVLQQQQKPLPHREVGVGMRIRRSIQPFYLAVVVALLATASYAPDAIAVPSGVDEGRSSTLLVAGNELGSSAAIKEVSRTIQPTLERELRHVPGTSGVDTRQRRAACRAFNRSTCRDALPAQAPPRYCLYEVYRI